MIKRSILFLSIVLVLAALFGVVYFQRNFHWKQDYIAQDVVQTSLNQARTVGYNENKNAYFGDLHIHTGWSFDAFIYNVRTNPDDAYLYAKGHKIPHVSGDSIQINRPLDFMAVTDHAEYMGVLMQMLDDESPFAQLDLSKRVTSPDPEVSSKAILSVGMSISFNKPYRSLIDEDVMYDTWQKVVQSADDHYEPGVFTTFPGYEWTTSIGEVFASPQYAYNMHRNVIFKGGKVSGMPFSSFHSQDPEDLWKWLDEQRQQGIEVLAIPHNANISDGNMYGSKKVDGSLMDLDYINARMRNEPISEVVQIKGQSMAHPALSPNDEFADFEVYEYLFAREGDQAIGTVKGSYVRDALKDGLRLEKEIGANPYKFGFIGSSDSHNSATNAEEENHIGRSGLQDATPIERLANTTFASMIRENSVAGLAGVWAEENTREAIFEALERKETFATSGPRIKLRFFGGWTFSDSLLQDSSWIEVAYNDGVAMGGDLYHRDGADAPMFIISALKDPDGANLDRVQIIKGWIDDGGNTQEHVHDIAWSGARKRNTDGSISTVGSTVDERTALYTNDIGAITLQSTWQDPDFNPDQASFYFVRALEIPTPRWTTYDAVRTDQVLPDDVPSDIQERAWSSPIWYHPELKNE